MDDAGVIEPSLAELLVGFVGLALFIGLTLLVIRLLRQR